MDNTHKQIFRTTNTLALILSVSVAVLLPLGYFSLSYQYNSAVLETEAEASAYFVSQLINANPEFWRFSQHRLEETLSHHISKERRESRRIVDLDNKVIASNSVPVPVLVMTRSHDLHDSGTVVARIEVGGCIKPILINTALFGALGIFLGAVGFICFKIFPFHALSDVLRLLYESEEKFRAITTTAVDGIIVMDNKGKITYWNPAAERLFGHSQQEVIGKDLHLMLAPQKYHAKYKNGFNNFITTGHGPAIGKTFEFVGVRKDGTELPIEVSTSAIKLKDEWHAVGLVHNITERKTAENKMAQLYEEIKSEAEISKLLLELVETLSTSLKQDELIKKVLDLAPRYLKFNRVSLFFYDDDARGFALAGAYGFSHAEKEKAAAMTIKHADFPAMDVLMKGECVIIDQAVDCVLVSDEIIEAFDMNSALLVPISFRGKTSGMICGIYTSGQPVGQKDSTLLKGLADGLGIALQNSRLYKESNDRLIELTSKVETIKAMAQLDREILSTIDRSEILKSAVLLTSRLIPSDRVAVLLRNEGTYSVVAEWGAGRFAEMKYDIDRSHFNIIETRQVSLSIPDISIDNVDCQYHKDQSSIGIKSSLLVPLINRGQLMGILDIGSQDCSRHTSSHLSTAEKIAAQISVALENSRLYEDLEHLLINTITSLAHTIDAKSPWTKGHSERVTGFAVEIAKEMGLKEKDINHIKLCGILHDIGKIGTYDVVLDKPGKLTDEEFELVKKHPEKGAEILAPIKQLKDIVPGILYHHERYDGKGYPFGIKGDDIPLCASILSVADSFDSMTADRPYRKSPGIEYAIAELKRCSGSQFNPKIVEVFLKVLKKMDDAGQIPARKTYCS